MTKQEMLFLLSSERIKKDKQTSSP